MTELACAAELLRAGELVAFPTETVYGLGADASNPTAVAKIFAAKSRPADHPLIVHLPDAAYLKDWAVDIPAAAFQLVAAFWPGPLTLILKRATTVSDAVTGGQDTIGLRVPAHPLALELLRTFKGGIAAPSANRFGHISPTTARHVREELKDRVALILDGGPCAVGIESTILDLSRATPEILRPGAISAEDIARVIGCVPRMTPLNAGNVASAALDVPRVSGSLAAHYAPNTPLQLVADAELADRIAALVEAGQRVAVLAFATPPTKLATNAVRWHRAATDPAVYAHDLYATLRELDATESAAILVQRPPQDEAWRAVNDRLQRAAAGSGQA
jgi:L-threonylcarbamoyladenylate synthase